MLPRKLIRDEFYRLFQEMSIPVTRSKGRINRYHEQDLPAINVTTFSDIVTNEDRVHGSTWDLFYEQAVTVELHMPLKDEFEDALDELEEEFWLECSSFDVAGVDIQYDRGELTNVQDVDNPHAIKLLSFTARYSVNSNEPQTIIV